MAVTVAATYRSTVAAAPTEKLKKAQVPGACCSTCSVAVGSAGRAAEEAEQSSKPTPVKGMGREGGRRDEREEG